MKPRHRHRSAPFAPALFLVAISPFGGTPCAAAEYVLQGLGVLEGMATEAVAINASGQVAGTQTGT
jgi:hypothetical protein